MSVCKVINTLHTDKAVVGEKYWYTDNMFDLKNHIEHDDYTIGIFTEIRGGLTMNKAERREYYVQKFMHSNCTSVMNYYAKPSDTKVAIEQHIKSQMRERNGKRYRILSGNCFTFICAYVYPKEDKWILVVKTVSNHYELELLPQEIDSLCLQ